MLADPQTPGSLGSALDRIRATFLDGLDMRILNIENSLAEARRGDIRAALAGIRHETHKIAGIAGSLGYPDTSAEARRIETTIDAGIETEAPQAVLSRIEPMMEPFLDHLEELLDQA